MIFQPNGGAGGGEGNAKFEIVEYIGNGTFGEQNKISVTFSFAPSIVLMSSGGSLSTLFNGVTNNSNKWIYMMQGMGINSPNGYSMGTDEDTGAKFGQWAYKSEDGKTLTWWVDNDNDVDDGFSDVVKSAIQYNINGLKYYYYAIG